MLPGELTGYSRKKTTQLRTGGATSVRASVGALWGPKQLDTLVDLDLSFEVVPEKSVLRRRREEDGSIGNQYVHRSLGLLLPPFFLTLILSLLPPADLVGYVLKDLFPNLLLVQAAQGLTASSSSSTGGRARLPRCRKRSTKFIVRLTPTNLLSLLQTLSCRLVCNFAHLLIYVMMGVNFVQIRATSM